MIYNIIQINNEIRTLINSTTSKQKANKIKKDLEDKMSFIKNVNIELEIIEQDYIKENPEPFHGGILSSSEYIIHTKAYNKWINKKRNYMRVQKQDLLKELELDNITIYTYEIEEVED